MTSTRLEQLDQLDHLNRLFDLDHLNPDDPYPLQGITVLDFGGLPAGPACGRMLADAGARVIRIRPPGDRPTERHRLADVGKESICLDLEDPDELAFLKRMIAHADVVVESFLPGVMARLGLAPEELVAQFPYLVVCSVSGSVGVGAPIADLLGGIYGYAGVLTALCARERTGRGSTVEFSMPPRTAELEAPGSPMRWGTWNSMGTTRPSPSLDEHGDRLRAEFGSAPAR